MDRAFSDLTIRSVDEEKRILRGVATTPRVDRALDRILPLGCSFTNPCVLLLQHAHDRPVGTVVFEKPTREGVRFEAHIPKIQEPGVLQDRTNEAWQSARAKILRHVSIGFRPTKPPIPNEEGGYDYPAVELYELSLCSVPCQPDAEILEVRRADRRGRDPVVRIGAKKPCPVVKLSGVTRAAWNGTLKINTTPRNKPGQPFKIRKINRTGTVVVKLSPGGRERLGLDRPKKPLPVVKLTEADVARAKRRLNHRVVKLGR
jgi:HK97 family phage prohead protease